MKCEGGIVELGRSPGDFGRTAAPTPRAGVGQIERGGVVPPLRILGQETLLRLLV